MRGEWREREGREERREEDRGGEGRREEAFLVM